MNADGSNAESLRSAFENHAEYQVGVEEEFFLLDPATFELLPRAESVLERVADDANGRFQPELSAAQLEIATTPAATVAVAAERLLAMRRRVASACGDSGRLVAAAVPPCGSGVGELSQREQFKQFIRDYEPIARRQMISAVHVHVSVPDADRALQIHDALRSYLPELSAVAAAAPWYRGRDTGLASIRPALAELIPRQVVPPPLRSWESFAEELGWGDDAKLVPRPAAWKWELRLHQVYGTIEVRVADVQPSSAETAGFAAIVYALIAALDERLAAGEMLPVAPSWRIAENRWSACRHGLDGTMADLLTGRREATLDRIQRLLDEITSSAQRHGCAGPLEQVRASLCSPLPTRMRAVAADGDGVALANWLADRFLDPYEEAG
ncbi:MAG: carboxylate-amine ligase [Solirubrobacteraceae bacterium]